MFGEQGEEAILHIITCVRNIRVMVNAGTKIATQTEPVDEDALLLEDHTPSNQQARMDR